MPTLFARLGLFLTQLALAAPAVWQLAVLANAFASRLTYPMDIEWMEGGMLLHAHRMLRGEAIYGPTSGDFIPFPYAPLFVAVIAGVGRLFSLDYWTGRAVSIAFFALACAVLFREVSRSFERGGGAKALALLGVASAACSFPVVGGWFDLIRNDSMMMGLVLLGAALVSDGRPTRRRAVSAALVLVAAVFTKQTAAFALGWVGLYLLIFHTHRGIWFGLTAAVSAGAFIGVMQIASGGTFVFWVFTVMSRHVVRGQVALNGAKILLGYAPFLALMPLLATVLYIRGWLRRRTLFWLGMLAAATGASLTSFAKAGGYLNTLMPSTLLAGPVFLMLLADVARAFGPSHSAARASVRLGAMALASGFVVLKAVDMKPHIPSEEAWTKAAALNAFIASLKGGVVIPHHPFLAVRNGHTTPQFHAMAYEDVINARLTGLDMPGVLRRTGAKWAILTGVEIPHVRGWLHQVYKPDRPLPVHVTAITGHRSGPRDLFRLRPPVNKQNARPLFDFEGDLQGWKLTGTAFDVVDEKGSRFLTSKHAKLRDEATGRAASPAFTIDRTHIGFQIGGGKSRKTRVELRVRGALVTSTPGIESGVLIEVVWDIRKHKGQEGQIVLIDEETNGWGYIKIDQVELFDVAGAP
jgi:hypothetical protein